MVESEIYKSMFKKLDAEDLTLMTLREMSELQKDLCMSALGVRNKTTILEGITDVCIMFEQMKLLYDCTAEDVERCKARKLENLEEWIKETEE